MTTMHKYLVSGFSQSLCRDTDLQHWDIEVEADSMGDAMLQALLAKATKSEGVTFTCKDAHPSPKGWEGVTYKILTPDVEHTVSTATLSK